ncbi:MAG: hypothetical protein GY702_16975 [Desulfobulbaceae bacterium]|nr:hypothetical protein [Desulfobulbaceae bacterium]
MATTEPDNNNHNNPGNRQSGTNLLIRVVLLAVWVAMVDLWLARHFPNERSMLLGIPLGSLWCVAVIDFLMGKEKRQPFVDSIKDYARQFLTTHFKGGVISVLYIGSALFAATYTTVSIDATPDGQRKFSLSSLAFPDKKVSADTAVDKVVDIHMWINPFAPEYRLEIKGFLSSNIRVKPFFGTLVVPDRDLFSPTVLFRPDFTSNHVLGGGGWFQLYQKNSDGFVMIAEDQGTHARYLGPQRNQPRELHSDWRLQTAELGLGKHEVAILMRRWRNPKLLETDAVAPNQILCALVSNIDKTRYVSGIVAKITRQEYIDLLIGDLWHDQDTSTINHAGASLCAWLDADAG